MTHSFQRAAVLSAILFLGVTFPLVSPAQTTNGVFREVYTGIGGSAISDLTNSPSFPSKPSLETIEPIFEAPTSFGDNYGTRMRALVTAPITGNYIFWIASDDAGRLYLSTDENPSTKRLIAAEPSWGSPRDWDTTARRTNALSIFPGMNPNLPANRSDYAFGSLTLNAGQRYYIEALQKEGGGGDNLAVAWQLPGGVMERPIPGNRLTVYGLGPPVIVTQPASVAVIEGGSAMFQVVPDHRMGAVYQWFVDNGAIQDATNDTLTVGPVSLSQNLAHYRCYVANSFGNTNSTDAILTVSADTTPPSLSTVGNLGEPTVVFVVFSEPIDPISATSTNNYAINNQVRVLRAERGVDSQTIILTTTPIPPNVTCTLTVNNVRDLASTPNTIAPNSQRTFSVTTQPVDIGFLNLPRENIGPSSRRHGVVISEVMYHPAPRADHLNLEFVELYNAQPWFQEIGGWRISGAIDYTFPSNTVIQARSYVVVAANPTDFQQVYNPANLFGPFLGSNSLQNSSGTLRLRNDRDAILFEMNYSGDPPYPAAPDGGGHSLVLARPSYGEGDPRAWATSETAGGTPGSADGVNTNFRTVMINEVLAHTDLPQIDYVELFNYGTSAVSLAGCILTDDVATNRFTLPANKVIPARGFLLLTETEIGFRFSAKGEGIFLKAPNGARVIDALKFDAQENGVAWGRYPDGASAFSRLTSSTPGTNNAAIRVSNVVINEIMFDPVSSDSADQYVELYNRGTSPVDLGGWHLRDAISYNFPTGIVLRAGGYLVIAKNAAHLRTNYSALNLTNALGNFSGSLSSGGERIELNMPDEIVSVNGSGQLETNTIHIMVDEVAYGAGGRWGRYAAGGGSSLELRDPHSDHRLAPNWADSDEASKSQWVNVEATGVMDNGWADANQLHITLQGPGECLLDEIQVIRSGGSNVIANGTFESGVQGWVFQGNHNQSGWEPAEGYNSGGSLHLRSVGRGDTGANRVRTQLPFILAPGSTVTLRAKARYLKGNPNLLLRLRGNWMEAPGYILTAKNLGTPGERNTRAVTNAGPAITETRHFPPLPAANQPVLVVARVNDPDGLAYLSLNYRIDPGQNYITLAMTNNGAGAYSAVIPGQASGTAAAFFIRAQDGFSPPATSSFPSDAPARECLVRWGDNTVPGQLGLYRFWISATNVNRWVSEEKMSNNPKDVTFIYGTNRIIYNAGAWFHGSPYHSPGYDSPVGASCDYDMNFPGDDPLLGENEINLFRPGNGGGDSTAQAETHGYWFGDQFGIPFLYLRPVFVFVNGQRRDVVLYDAQQPNGNFIRQWFPDDPDGDLHKVQLGFEFGDLAYGASEPGYNVVGADLNRYTTTGGVFKQARYRQTWPLRSASISQQNDYTNLFNLVRAAQTTAPLGGDTYTRALSSVVDVEEWYKVDVAQHLFNNPDSFSYGGGQNAFVYKPELNTWKLFLWDIDFAFGGSASDSNLTVIGGAEHGPRNDHPPFARIYWQALIEAANGMLLSSRSNPILDARYNGMQAVGAAVGSPTGIKNFIATRRSLILSQIAARQSLFRITSNGGVDFATNRNLITLSGTAPLEARTILINGRAYPLTWTSLSNWVVRIPLLAGTNVLNVTGLTPKGAPVPAVNGTIRVNYTGISELPPGRVVINEIMYNPAFANASYIELFNNSTSSAFDLSGWLLKGIDYIFPDGTIIEPGTFLVIAKDRFSFADIYKPTFAYLADFDGSLDNDGETLTLVAPGIDPSQDVIVDQVTYSSLLPWPPEANGLGSSLQLIDAAQDNSRVSNWAAAPTNAVIRFTPGTANSVRAVKPAYPSVWLNEILPNNIPTGTNDVSDHLGDRDPWVELYNGGTVPLDLNGYFLATNYSNLAQWAFPSNTVVNPGQFLLVWLDGEPGESIPGELHTSFRAAPAASSIVLSQGSLATILDFLNYEVPTPGRSFGSFPDGTISGRRVFAHTTARAPNDAVFPPVDIRVNEWMADNVNGLLDPANQQAQDWFELYNPGKEEVDLSGYYLSDTLTNKTDWKIPDGTVIPPGGYLLVWADGEKGPDFSGDLHAKFSLSKNGESIGLFAPDGLLIDGVTFGAQLSDVSEGRFPDGAAIFYPMTNATPRQANFVSHPNHPPVLSFITDKSANEGAELSFTAVANDSDVPAQTLTFSLGAGAPAGASIQPGSGLFRWTPTPAQSPGVYSVTLRVTDDGTPALSASQTISITVNEANNPPVLAPILSYTIGEGSRLVITNSATDPDTPAQTLTFSLGSGAPQGMLIDPVSGLIDWTPSEAQGPGDYSFMVQVTDNGVPPLSDAKPLSIFVSEVNSDPDIFFPAEWTVGFGTTVQFTAGATDPDLPAQLMTFTVDPPVPSGVNFDRASGFFAWTVGPGDLGTNILSLRVTDSGSPARFATRTLTVVVLPEALRLVAEPSGPGLAITFNTTPGGTYQVEYKDALSDPAWTALGPERDANQTSISVTDNPSPARVRFYRVVRVR